MNISVDAGKHFARTKEGYMDWLAVKKRSTNIFSLAKGANLEVKPDS